MNIFYLTISSFKSLIAHSIDSSLQNIDVETNESFDIMGLIIFFAVGLSVLLNVLLLYLLKNNRGNNTTLREPKENYDDCYKSIESKNRQLENENKNLKDKLSLLERKRTSNYEEKRNIQIESEIQPSISNPPAEHYLEDEKPQTFDLKINQPNTIYLPSPFEDNRFSIEDVSTEQTTSSLYQIILDASNTTGKLFIIENADFTRALNSPDHYLEKACIYENAFNPHANGVQIVEPGKVKLENQDWLILQKIKVKFI